MNTKYNIVIFVLTILITFGSCETLDLDINNDPNAITPDQGDPQLFLNGVMVSFARWLGDGDTDFEAGWEAGSEVVRLLQASGTLYETLYTATDFSDVWRGYAGHLKDIQTLKGIAEQNNLLHHLAVAQILESYSMTCLVDFFGDVPYSEAWLGTENLNPNVDDDQAVYGVALQLLKDAVTNLETSVDVGLDASGDIFYNGNSAKWLTLAKSLQFRIHNNTRLVDPAAAKAELNKLIDDGDLMSSLDDDWAIWYGTSNSNPDNRHPQWVDAYETNGPSGEYMSLYFMNLLVNGNGVHTSTDPRTRYYIYRQTGSYPDPTTAAGLFTLPCLGIPFPSHYTNGVDPYCTSVDDGYWGRPHLYASGLPDDNGKMSTWGVYPAGGLFDNDQKSPINNASGLKGRGLHPILLSSFVHFMRAEAALLLDTDDDAATQLEAGIRRSIERVQNIFTPSELNELNFSNIPSTADVNAYITEVMGTYAAAANDEERLNVIMTQAYIASWGNNVEAYNNYRRTGMPLNIHPALDPNPGSFIRSFRYPDNAINNNSNIDPKPNQTVKLFWDRDESLNLDF